MKVILSRKGFDSAAGGFASPVIMPAGIMKSLPIPSDIGTHLYSEVKAHYKDISIYGLIKLMRRDGQIRTGTWVSALRARCHLDPDLDRSAVKRPAGWLGSFGQVDASESQLENQGVKEGDLFLFFGWFREYTENSADGSLKPVPRSDRHVIFGYLQIGQILRTCHDVIPHAVREHPHAQKDFIDTHSKNNTIYIARETASWDENIPGYGLLQYCPEAVLTAEGMPRSRWNLEEKWGFQHSDSKPGITYHSEKSWKKGYFQSACRGQEFVIEDNEKIEAWARKLISDCRA